MVEVAKKPSVKREARKPATPPAPAPTQDAKVADLSAPAAKPEKAVEKPTKTIVKPASIIKPRKAAVAAMKATAAPMEAAAKAEEVVSKPVTQAPAGPVVAATPVPADPIETIEAVTSPAPSSDIITAETIAPISEGLEEMATPTQTVGIASEKLQSMFGDVGARFKASFEKSSKLGEEMVELTKGNVEAVVASARVAAKGSEALGQDVAEYGKKSLETAVAAMKTFASVKSPTELFQLQSDYAKSSFDGMVAEASKFSEAMMKLAGDVAQPLSTRYAVAAEKIKAVAL